MKLEIIWLLEKREFVFFLGPREYMSNFQSTYQNFCRERKAFKLRMKNRKLATYVLKKNQITLIWGFFLHRELSCCRCIIECMTSWTGRKKIKAPLRSYIWRTKLELPHKRHSYFLAFIIFTTWIAYNLDSWNNN